MNKYEVFINKLPSVQNEKDLCDLICELGLYMDSRSLYGVYEPYKTSRGGVWQDPFELAKFLWDSKEDFQGAQTFLEIGTFTGYSFFIIYEFLKAFVNKDIKAITIDPVPIFAECDIAPYIAPHYQQLTSEGMKAQRFDIVFIDGNHSAPWPLMDFENVGIRARCAFFHDINDKYCHDVVAAFNELETKYKSKRYQYASNANQFGIGIVFPQIIK